MIVALPASPAGNPAPATILSVEYIASSPLTILGLSWTLVSGNKAMLLGLFGEASFSALVEETLSFRMSLGPRLEICETQRTAEKVEVRREAKQNVLSDI